MNNCLIKIISYIGDNLQSVSKNYQNDEIYEIIDSIDEHNKKQHTLHENYCYCCLICTHIISSVSNNQHKPS
jgi:hypothetical protein